MSDCRFEQVEPGLIRCSGCGFTLRTVRGPQDVHRRCGQSPPEPLRAAATIPFAQQFRRLLDMAIAHGLASVPAIEIEHRLAACRACSSYANDRCQKYCVGCSGVQSWLHRLTAGECEGWYERGLGTAEALRSRRSDDSEALPK